jgi:LacI family transcriptional regulator
VDPATIHDVAQAAGVSVGTASRVLSGHPSTSADSRRRVQAAATELGYRPNARARSLRKAHTDTVGLLIPDVRNPFFADIAHNAERTALDHGLSTLLCNANESTQQQDRYLDLLYAQRVDGIIVAPQGDGSGALREIVDLKVPTVFVDRTIAGIDVPSVTSDNRAGIAQAIEHLASLGHARMGLVSGPSQTSTGRERLDAFRAAVAAHGLDVDPRLVHPGDYQSIGGVCGARALLDLPHPPTAIIAADSLMTFGVLDALQERNDKVGEELSVIGYDDVVAYRWLTPQLTVVAHDPARMGSTAIDMLVDVLNGKHVEPVVLESALIVRNSTGPAPRSGATRGGRR